MENGMKKLMIATVATVMIATTAHATDSLPLTDALVGHWCRVDDGVYKRGVWTCDGNLLVTQEGYTDDGDDFCEFTEVERLPSKDGYAVKCSATNKGQREAELRIVGGALHYRRFSVECGRVGEAMSDGFLNLRTGPGMQYAVRARLVTSDALWVGRSANEWTRVSVPRFRANGKDFTGWVGSRYVTDIGQTSCHTP